MQWIGIALGGALGAVSRYGLSQLLLLYLPAHYFFVATMAVNLAGCFAFGLLIPFISHAVFKFFVLVGFLGSFTTFSAFHYENYLLIKEQAYVPMLLNIGLSVILGLVACILGVKLASILLN